MRATALLLLLQEVGSIHPTLATDDSGTRQREEVARLSVGGLIVEYLPEELAIGIDQPHPRFGWVPIAGGSLRRVQTSSPHPASGNTSCIQKLIF
jgi:hypothetical protein